MPAWRFSLTTGTAFAVLIALICGLGVNSLLQLHTLGDHLSKEVAHHNKKIDLITQTQVSAHMRTDSLFRMVTIDDPVKREAYLLAFNQAGIRVRDGRAALRQTGLSPDEQRIFDAQTRLVSQTHSVQQRVIDLLQTGRNADAKQVLVQEVIPRREIINQQLNEMRMLYQQNNLAAQKQAEHIYRQAFILTLGLSIGAIALALLIAWRTLRKIRIKTQQIQDQMLELERSRAALLEEATHDPLTGLANRRLFYDRLQQAIRHAHRYGGKVGILYVDLDHFKAINDHYGHHVGDAVLTEVAKRLSISIRYSDSIARLGGDEFAVLLEGLQGREDLHVAARAVEQALSEDTDFFGIEVAITASIGQAIYPDDGDHEDALVRAADAAMYRVKYSSEQERQRQLLF
jgi:diguanylate cyclase (GGDEF)-like protein